MNDSRSVDMPGEELEPGAFHTADDELMLTPELPEGGWRDPRAGLIDALRVRRRVPASATCRSEPFPMIGRRDVPHLRT